MWKKRAWIPQVAVTNPTFTGYTAYAGLEVQNPSFDMTRLNTLAKAKAFFAGFTASSTYYSIEFDESATLKFVGSSATETYPTTGFDTTTGVIKNGSGVFNSAYRYLSFSFSYSGTKILPAYAGDAVGFVVDNDSNAYPNGAVHTDGYYYELLASVPSTNAMSLSDNALAVVQQDYRNQIITEVNT